MTARQVLMDRFQRENVSSIDCRGGTGPYAVVRRCRRWHSKGRHENWYRHIVFQQFNTVEEAQEAAQEECPGNRFGGRVTDRGADCRSGQHTINYIRYESGEWRNTQIPRNFADDDGEEQAPIDLNAKE
jgi:hypothetical protein